MPGISTITIDQQLAEIGVRRTPAQMHIEQQQMEMKITTEQPHMNIERKNPSFKVIRKKANIGTSMKSSQDISKDYRDKGRSDSLRSAKSVAHSKNSDDEVKKFGSKVGRLARNTTMSTMIKKREAGHASMSKGSPEVEWDKGYMRINWSKHSIVIDWDGEYMPKVTIDPKYSIEIYLRTEPYFRIIVNEGKDMSIPGSLVNKAI